MLSEKQIDLVASLAVLPTVSTVAYIGHGQLDLLHALVFRTQAQIYVFDYSDQWRIGNAYAPDDEGPFKPGPERPEWFDGRIAFFAEGIAPGDLFIDETFRLQTPVESGRILLDYRQCRVVYLPNKKFNSDQNPDFYTWTISDLGMVGHHIPTNPLLRDLSAARHKR